MQINSTTEPIHVRLSSNETVELKVKLLEHCINKPEYMTNGASGMDIEAAIDRPIKLKSLERYLVPTGLIMDIPKGYEVQIRPRSGLSIKHGITLINCVGTIDEDYRGEVKVPLVNLSSEEYTIFPGDRIAQMIICKVYKAKMCVVENVSLTARASGGFGSTGL